MKSLYAHNPRWGFLLCSPQTHSGSMCDLQQFQTCHQQAKNQARKKLGSSSSNFSFFSRSKSDFVANLLTDYHLHLVQLEMQHQLQGLRRNDRTTSNGFNWKDRTISTGFSLQDRTISMGFHLKDTTIAMGSNLKDWTTYLHWN